MRSPYLHIKARSLAAEEWSHPYTYKYIQLILINIISSVLSSISKQSVHKTITFVITELILLLQFIIIQPLFSVYKHDSDYYKRAIIIKDKDS